MINRLGSRLPLVAVSALLLAGCGGSSSRTSSTSTHAAKSQLIARADPICKELNARRAAANAKVGAVTDGAALSKVAKVAPVLAAYERSALAELRTLTAPASLAAAWRKILAGIEALAGNTAKLGVEAKGNDLKQVEGLIHDDQQQERKLITVAAAAGFAHCGRNV